MNANLNIRRSPSWAGSPVTQSVIYKIDVGASICFLFGIYWRVQRANQARSESELYSNVWPSGNAFSVRAHIISPLFAPDIVDVRSLLFPPTEWHDMCTTAVGLIVFGFRVIRWL